jgi:uncharacterized damage-inducible protein DinB
MRRRVMATVADVLPCMFRPLCERLRGTPTRLEEMLSAPPPSMPFRPTGGGWSVHEHAGHLVEVERLWRTRIAEYLVGATALTTADMRNRRTEDARYNERPLGEILAAFRAARAGTMAQLDPLSLADAARSAHHPRLDRPMRLVDLCLFAAEHDDHHLALIHAQLGRE